MATSSESTGVLQMVKESSLHDIIKLNVQNLVKTIKKLEYFNQETDEILATDDLENWPYETTLQRKSRDSDGTTAAENWSWSANWRYRWTAILIDKTWKGSSENKAIDGWVMSKRGEKNDKWNRNPRNATVALFSVSVILVLYSLRRARGEQWKMFQVKW